MGAEMLVGIIGIVLTTAIAIYAILDARNLVKRNLKLERDLVYLRLKNDLVWGFVDSTEEAYSVEIAKGFHDFGLLAQALNPGWTEDDMKTAVEKESLQFAEELVRSGKATWKKDFDLDRVRKAISAWKAEKNVERVKTIMGDTKLKR